MSVFSTSVGAVSTSLISEFGEACTFSRKTLSSFDPNTSTRIVSSTATFTSSCVPEEFELDEIDNTNVLKTDIKLLVGPIVGNEPILDDTVEFSNKSYRIVMVNEVIVNSVTVLYELQVRG